MLFRPSKNIFTWPCMGFCQCYSCAQISRPICVHKLQGCNTLQKCPHLQNLHKISRCYTFPIVVMLLWNINIGHKTIRKGIKVVFQHSVLASSTVSYDLLGSRCYQRVTFTSGKFWTEVIIFCQPPPPSSDRLNQRLLVNTLSVRLFNGSGNTFLITVPCISLRICRICMCSSSKLIAFCLFAWSRLLARRARALMFILPWEPTNWIVRGSLLN